MDFFASQERARRATRRLVFWFALCVAGVVAVLYLLAALARPLLFDGPPGAMPHFWDPELFAGVAVPVSVVVVGASLVKLMQLAGGGAVVARDLGGRPVSPATTDTLEKRLINVVDEMAISSGIAAPQIWILEDEEGINAFAAGTDPANAVIGVTRGCLERLTRAELQGVVAHEFAHIVNGDMRLNMRLIGWVFGLVVVTMLGRGVLRSLRFVRTSNSRDKGGGVLLVVAIGAALWLVGSLGAFFARLLQAAVSRQREFLADASAVQFTRDPSGLAGALKKVGGFDRGGEVRTPRAAEARHMFFARSDMLANALATHPPLAERIRAIEPSWQGRMTGSRREESFATETPAAGFAPRRRAAEPPPLPARPAQASAAPETLGDSRRIDRAVGAALQARLAAGEIEFTSKDDAKAMLAGLMLARDADQARAASRWLATRAGDEFAARAATWQAALAGRSAGEKLAVIDLSLPWLRQMGRGEAAEFIEVSEALISADGQVTLFEFMLQKVLERHVAIGLGLRPAARVRHHGLAALANESAVILGAFAAVSGDHAAGLAAAAAEFGTHAGIPLPALPAAASTLDAVARALAAFDAASPPVKGQLLRLGALVVMRDGTLADAEAELLRAVAEAIGAPIPPLARPAP
jgi:Zn-dependent protease with chaperone function